MKGNIKSFSEQSSFYFTMLVQKVFMKVQKQPPKKIFTHKVDVLCKLRSEKYIASYLFVTLKLFILKHLTDTFKAFDPNGKTVLEEHFLKILLLAS